MASPDKGKKAAPKSPPVQDSPTFGYLASLSPLKLVNVRPTVYENIDVPSPQLIFKTPNFNRPRKSTVLESRSQHPTLADTENHSSGYGNCRVLSQSMDMTRSSVSSSTANTTSCINKEEATGNPSPNHSCTSPSNCVDAFLADPLENGDNSSSSPDLCVMGASKDIQDDRSISSENQMNSSGEDLLEAHPRTTEISVNEHIDDSIENSMHLGRQHLKQGYFPPHYPQADSIGIEEPSSELNIAYGNKHTSKKAFANSRENHQSKDDPGNESLIAETMEVNKELIGEEGPISKNDTNYTKSLDVSDSFTQSSYSSRYNIAKDQSFVSTAKECDIDHYGKENHTTSDALLHGEQDLKLQTDKSDQSDELDCTPQLHPVSPQNTDRDDDHTDDFVQTFSAATGNQNSYVQEDGAQHQRGKRKRLQFEEVENLRIANSTSCNYATGTSIVDLSIPPLEVEKVDVSHAEPIMFSSNKQAIQSVSVTDPFTFPVKVDKSAQYKGCPPLTVPRPSGIGLHLNTIGSTASIKCHSNIHAEKPACEDRDNDSQRTQKDPSSVHLIGPAKLTLTSETSFLYVGNKNDKEELTENQTFNVSTAFVDQPALRVKPLNVSMPFKHIDRYMTPCIFKSLPSEVSRSEESTHMSPKKKRKKATENDGQKRCNCKRSKCLKLYCDCFAAGSFCSEACACRECCNKVEHQDAVIESRQQIESRNPLAFAPKVVVRVSNPPKDNEDSKPNTPSSARHKRGCNCKKSLCLKKYCECFQAGVGCSAGCRCEGCKNTFGKKDGCDISEMIAENRKPKEAWERDLSGELEGIEVKRQVSDSKHCHSRLSPLTPVVQSTNGEVVSKPHLPASYYPSPESSSTDMDSIKKGDSTSLISYDPSTSIDPLSPGWDVFPDFCNLSPLLRFSPNPGCSSSSTSTSERKVLQMKLFEGSSRISLGSLSWRSSPITPVPLFGESKPVNCSNPEDDTPEILKEGGSPIKAVTATSPNQKRVSPPHQVACSSNSKSSAGVRSVRKFKLQSVPSFPPLTPYSTSNREDGA